MMGINVNCKKENFIKLIGEGLKTQETRKSPSLDPYIGKTIYLVETGNGKATAKIRCKIESKTTYENQMDFYKDFDKHRITPDSFYAPKKGEVIYGYNLTDIKILKKPIPCETLGIVARKVVETNEA